MRHPRLNRQVSTRVSIPLLEGGINNFDGATHIQDKQLIDAKNVWFDGATLRTRPKIKNVTIDSGINLNSEEDSYGKIVKTIDTDCGKLMIYSAPRIVDGTYNITVKKCFENNGTYKLKSQDLIKAIAQNHKINAYLGNDGFVYCIIGEFADDVLDKAYMYKINPDNLSIETLLDAYRDSNWYYNENKLYSPLLYMNGKGNRYSYLTSTSETEYAVASFYEGKNMLPSAMKLQFITDGYSNQWQVPVDIELKGAKITLNTLGLGFTGIYKCMNANKSYNPPQVDEEGTAIEGGNHLSEPPIYNTINLADKTIEFIFKRTDISTWLSDDEYLVTGKLLQLTKDSEDKFQNIEYELGSDESIGHYFYKDDTGNFVEGYEGDEEAFLGERLRAQLKVISGSKATITFLRIDKIESTGEVWDYKPTQLPSTISSNIELTAYKNPFEYFEKLLSMNVSALYGGGDGIYGGSRVFLAGCENYFCYSNSAKGKETYFSENSFVRVEDTSPIVALKQMGEALVIFKEKSIYQTVTTYSDSVSASDVQEGKVVDMATTYVYFPISTLNDDVGCDLPNTIKLCLNRLVWATKDGKVYCLVTQSNVSQKNIYCISDTIERKFYDEEKNCLLNDGACAMNFRDYYLLFCGNKVWALNYNKDSFRYVYSYTNKTNNASTRYFTWWYWELDESTQFFGGDDKDGVVKLFLEDSEFVNSNENHEFFVYKIDEYESEDDCDVSIETKIFDFGMPERYKKIEKIFIGVGNDIYADIDLTIHTDKGDIYHRQFSVDNNEQESRFTAEYGDGIRIIPIANRVKRFGIKITGIGVMSIESIGIYYKMLGEVM